MGSLYFFIETLARNHFVRFSAIAQVNAATVAASDALPTQVKLSFDAGRVRTCPIWGTVYYQDRKDSMTCKWCTQDVTHEYRQFADTHFAQRTDCFGFDCVEWFTVYNMSILCNFGKTLSYLACDSRIQFALDDLTVHGVLPDTIPSVFGTERGTVVNFCIEGINKHRITVRHSALSTADERRFLYEQMRNVLFWYLCMMQMSSDE